MAQFFTPLRNVLKHIISLDVDEIAFQIAQQQPLQDLVIELNTESQLFDKGEDSTGRTLESIGGSYSPFTVKVKQAKGQPTNRVTLFDTGDFYASFVVKPYRGGFEIDANPQKDDTNLFDEWGEEIVGLNEENLQIIINFFKDAVLEQVNRNLRAA
jgi:hypothetical protein